MADTQIAESIFSAIDTIVNKRLENLPYDKTILATIEDNSNAIQGEYMVNDGSSSMRAYSDYTDYNVGDQVYVSIPQGDMDQQKIIIGKYNIDDTNGTPLGYHDPMDDLVDITGNIFDSEENIFKLVANGDKLETTTIWDWQAKNSDENPIAAFNLLAISAGFQSSVGRNAIVSEGNYGLRLDFKAIQKATQIDEEREIYYSFYLDSSGFFGDPYNFETFYKQSKLLNLKEKNIDRIDAMRLVFYQEKNFRDPYGDLVPIADYNNLAVSDIEIKFGYDISDFLDKENTVLLYTFDTKTYVNSITPNLRQQYKETNFDNMDETAKSDFFKQINQKTILCRWIKNSEDGIICYGMDDTEELPEGASIRWYRYNYQEQIDKTKYSVPPGDYWEEIPDTRDQFIISFTPEHASTASEKIKVVIWDPTQEYIEETYKDDKDYTAACEQTIASNVIKFNFDPLEFLRQSLSSENTIYQAFLRYHSIIADECNSNEDFLTIANYANNINDENSWFNHCVFINEKFEELFSSDNNEDKYIICSSIKRQVQMLKDYLTIFYFQYFYIRQSPNFESVQSRIQKELEILEDFYLEKFTQLSYLDYFLAQNGDQGAWKNEYTTQMQNYANDFNRDPNWYIEIKSERFTNNAAYFNIAHYGLIIQYLDEILNECNKEASDETKDYNKIKTKFSELPDRIEEQAELYYNTWYGRKDEDHWDNPISALWNGSTPAEINYKQVLFYSKFDEIYNEDIINRDNIKMSIQGSSKYEVSDELEFTNEDPSAWLEYSKIKNLKLEVDKANLNGVYRFYNDDGSIINDGETQVVRIITAKYTNPMTGDEVLDSAVEKIIWKVPKLQTMIVKPEEGYEYRKYDYASPTAASFSQGQYYIYNSSTNDYDLATDYVINTQYYVKNNVEFTEDNDWYYITRQVPTRDKGEYGQEIPCSTELGFRVRGYYMPDAKNNTIHCIVIKNDRSIEADTTLTFGVQGLMGTDYTFILQYANNIPFVEFQGEPVQLISKVYDAQGNEITEGLGSIQYSWYHGDNSKGLSISATGVITPNKNETDINNYAHYIVKAIISNVEVNIGGKSRTLDLESYMPIIVVRKNFDYTVITSLNNNITLSNINVLRYEGKAYITYDNTGTNPQFYKDSFKVWGLTQKHDSIELTNGNWNTIHTADCEVDGVFNQNFYPYIYKNSDNTNTLIVPSIYLANGANEIISLTYTVNDNIIFIMPLYISHRVYESSLLNSWDGSLTLDKENGIMLSAMVGAGRKNSNNTFSGVLMGDVTPADYNASTIGLYGYFNGEQSFGFKVDGTAFLGRASRAQIQFDGNDGTIVSTGYLNGSAGTYINLANGNIDIRGTSNSQIILNANPGSGQPYFEITSKNNHVLMHVGGTDGNFYLKSDNYNGTVYNTANQTGTFIDLNEGYFHSTKGGMIGCWNFNTNQMYSTNAGVNKNANIGQAFWAGGTDITGNTANFRVSHTGHLYASDLEATGSLTATKLTCTGAQDWMTLYYGINETVTIEQGIMSISHTGGAFGPYDEQIIHPCHAAIGFLNADYFGISVWSEGGHDTIFSLSAQHRVVLSCGSAMIQLNGNLTNPFETSNQVSIDASNGIVCNGMILSQVKLISNGVIEGKTTIRVNKKGTDEDGIARLRAINDTIEVRCSAQDKGVDSKAGVYGIYPEWQIKNGQEVMKVDSDGIVTKTDGTWLIYIDTHGNVHCNSPSDRRMKKNIQKISTKEVLTILSKIDIVQFNYLGSSQLSSGIIAQDLRDLLINENIGYRDYLQIESKSSIKKDNDEFIFDLSTPEKEVKYSIDYSKLVPIIWKGWQIHNNQIEQLNNQIDQLQKEIQELKEKIK